MIFLNFIIQIFF